jgi:CRISPR-associated protein (TIGR03984 family)
LIDDKGAPRDEDDSEIPIDDVYELRAFQAGFELRWLQESRRPAKTVIVGEYRPSNLKDWEEDSQPYQERLDRQYLLWGAAADSQPDSGWTRLEEARIVKLSVPINGIAARGCVTLHFHEYLADGDDDGNVVVIDQRLSHLAPFQP